MKALCIGNSTYNTIYQMSHMVKENTKVNADYKIEQIGGRALTYAYVLNHFNVDVYLASIIGNDLYGNIILEKLRNASINCKYLYIDENISTNTSVILSNSDNLSRTVISNKHSIKLDVTDYDTDFDVLVLDGTNYFSAINAISRNKLAVKILDAEKTDDDTLNLAKKVDYLICSLDFAQQVVNIIIDCNNKDSLYELYNKVSELFSANIIITLGKCGCIYKNNDEIKILEGLSVSSIDTTSAGDIFHACFAYGILQKWNIDKIVNFANMLAAYSTTKIDIEEKIAEIELLRRISYDNK